MAKKRKATKGAAKRTAKAKDLTARGNPKGGNIVQQAMTNVLEMMHDTQKGIVGNLRV